MIQKPLREAYRRSICRANTVKNINRGAFGFESKKSSTSLANKFNLEKEDVIEEEEGREAAVVRKESRKQTIKSDVKLTENLRPALQNKEQNSQKNLGRFLNKIKLPLRRMSSQKEVLSYIKDINFGFPDRSRRQSKFSNVKPGLFEIKEKPESEKSGEKHEFSGSENNGAKYSTLKLSSSSKSNKSESNKSSSKEYESFSERSSISKRSSFESSNGEKIEENEKKETEEPQNMKIFEVKCLAKADKSEALLRIEKARKIVEKTRQKKLFLDGFAVRTKKITFAELLQNLCSDKNNDNKRKTDILNRDNFPLISLVSNRKVNNNSKDLLPGIIMKEQKVISSQQSKCLNSKDEFIENIRDFDAKELLDYLDKGKKSVSCPTKTGVRKENKTKRNYRNVEVSVPILKEVFPPNFNWCRERKSNKSNNEDEKVYITELTESSSYNYTNNRPLKYLYKVNKLKTGFNKLFLDERKVCDDSNECNVGKINATNIQREKCRNYFNKNLFTFTAYPKFKNSRSGNNKQKFNLALDTNKTGLGSINTTVNFQKYNKTLLNNKSINRSFFNQFKNIDYFGEKTCNKNNDKYYNYTYFKDSKKQSKLAKFRSAHSINFNNIRKIEDLLYNNFNSVFDNEKNKNKLFVSEDILRDVLKVKINDNLERV